ncbi:2OG-Fe dioxygenase family protein [Microcoleus sp. AT9_A2]|uniref:2OG-Fe dioxygenase family protein n=1 Tax=Microcoleus sp. AT9_A2 TaxID=2818624 RepID=UPI002FD59C59
MKTVLESIHLDYAFMFTFKKVNSIKLEGFKEFFDDMPVDPYVKGKYRSRRLSRFAVNGNELAGLKHKIR